VCRVLYVVVSHKNCSARRPQRISPCSAFNTSRVNAEGSELRKDRRDSISLALTPRLPRSAESFASQRLKSSAGTG
jgi:hypothetical protein